MPITLADLGLDLIITRIGGNPETRQFLESLGFVPGTAISVVNRNQGNLIVRVKDARIAISQEMASKIIACGGETHGNTERRFDR